MTATTESGAGAGTAVPGSRASAGAKLKAAREAQGLSIAAVAQQLKLAPRQVQALEDDDYGRLPGRTFVRGFARNYARVLRLDPGAVIALLPAADSAPALERPGLGPARRPMGELPIDRAQRPSRIRWFFPLLLIVIVVVAGYYEYLREHGMLGAIGTQHASSSNESSAQGGTTSAGAPAALPNPLAAGETALPAGAGDGGTSQSGATPGPATEAAAPREEHAATPANSAAAASANPAANASTSATPTLATGAAAAASTAPAGVGAAQASTSAPEVPGSTGSISVVPAAGSPGAPLVLAFKGPSWVEVRDASGRVILKATEAGGTTRSIDGTAPFQLTLGDAPNVSVTFRGRPLDLGPYTRGDVARITLK